MSKIKAFIVDDSAVVRQVFTELLSASPLFEVVGSAQDPIFAERKMLKDWPDVIILDLEMPRMGGLEFLEKIMTEHPTPTVICSTLVQDGAQDTFKALAKGAMAVIPKPEFGVKKYLEDSNDLILQTLKEAASTKVRRRISTKKDSLAKLSEAQQKRPSITSSPINKKFDVIAIGASTGGTQALEYILTRLPANLPPIVIVQHMPEKFTLAFAGRLNGICSANVKEAQNGDELTDGVVYIAPGNLHMSLHKNRSKFVVDIKDGPPVGFHRPAVDVLFRAIAKEAGARSLGVMLTGMGRDGSKGMLEMKKKGAYNIAQDETSSVVFSMPKEAIEINAVDKICHLHSIHLEILNTLKS